MPPLPANADSLLYVAAALFATITILGRLVERVLPAPKNGPGREIVEELRELKGVIAEGARDQKAMIKELRDAHDQTKGIVSREDPETGLPRSWCQARHLTAEQTKDISMAIERGFERVAKVAKEIARGAT